MVVSGTGPGSVLEAMVSDGFRILGFKAEDQGFRVEDWIKG